MWQLGVLWLCKLQALRNGKTYGEVSMLLLKSISYLTDMCALDHDNEKISSVEWNYRALCIISSVCS